MTDNLVDTTPKQKCIQDRTTRLSPAIYHPLLDLDKSKLEKIPPKPVPPPPPVVKYTIPPAYDVIGVNPSRYDCCVQKVIDEMGKYIKEFKMIFVLGREDSPRDIVQFFPKYNFLFRAGTTPGTDPGVLANLEAHMPYFRSIGCKNYYYVDDLLIYENNKAPIKLMSGCDGIIVPTNQMVEAIQAEHVEVPIHVMKTHMDLPSFDMTPPYGLLTEKGKVNVLFASQGRVGAHLIVEMCEIMDQNPSKYKNVKVICLSHAVAQMRSILNRFRNINKCYYEYMPINAYYGLAQGIDIFLSPGEERDLDYMMDESMRGPWLHSKSCHKYTLAGAARKPGIYSPLRDYKEHVKHGETGFLANGVNEWIDYLDLLINDVDLAEKIGINARRDIENNFHIYRRIEQLVEIFKGIPQHLVSKKVEESKGISIYDVLGEDEA